MKLLKWMGDHPILTVILACIAFDGVAEIIKAMR